MIIVLAFTGLNVFTYQQITEIEEGYEAILERSVPLVFEIKDINRELSNQSAQVRGYIITQDPKYRDGYHKSRETMNSLLVSLEQKLITAEGKQQLEEVRAALAAYKRIADEALKIRDVEGEAAAVKFLAMADKELAAGQQTLTNYIQFLSERMELRKQQNLAAIDRLHHVLIILDVVIFVLAVGFALIFARRIAKPLEALAANADQVAAGDLTLHDVKYNRGDEIGTLVQAFKTMTENLRGLVTQVAKAAEQVAAASEELTASAEQSAQAAGQVAQTVTGIAAGADNQVAAVDQAVSIVGEMATAVNHIAATAEEVAARSGETARAAAAGEQAVNEATGQMAVINRTVADTALVVQKLGESSKQIGEIVDVISGIAGQTNLLALNAAIEAARAGEQGRGFAVVAEEVRKLAEQSQAAAQKIAVIIQGIQSETDTAVAAMRQGTLEVERGSRVIETAGERFSKIVSLVDDLNTQIQGISAASEQLAASSSEVVNSVAEIKKVAAETASSTQTISAAAEEQSASMQEIASSSQALSRMAQDLQAAVGKFKL